MGALVVGIQIRLFLHAFGGHGSEGVLVQRLADVDHPGRRPALELGLVQRQSLLLVAHLHESHALELVGKGAAVHHHTARVHFAAAVYKVLDQVRLLAVEGDLAHVQAGFPRAGLPPCGSPTPALADVWFRLARSAPLAVRIATG